MKSFITLFLVVVSSSAFAGSFKATVLGGSTFNNTLTETIFGAGQETISSKTDMQPNFYSGIELEKYLDRSPLSLSLLFDGADAGHDEGIEHSLLLGVKLNHEIDALTLWAGLGAGVTRTLIKMPNAMMGDYQFASQNNVMWSPHISPRIGADYAVVGPFSLGLQLGYHNYGGTTEVSVKNTKTNESAIMKDEATRSYFDYAFRVGVSL